MSINIRYLGGGQCHPVDEQAELIGTWLPSGMRLENRNGREAFEDLDDVDLFVVSGLHYTKMDAAVWPTPMTYIGMTDADLAAFRSYVASGRPVLGFHGGVASYDDRPEFGQLIGVYWNWVTTAHTPVAVWLMEPGDVVTPITKGVEAFRSDDEIYYNLQLAGGLLNTKVHLRGCYHDLKLPLIFTANGGRIGGAGKVGYFGLGHSMESVKAPEVKSLLLNTIKWLLAS
jgi:type 1 glutamine amidotransferase